ncbi:hypothetical protein R1flu_022524 [Riccia fluitans]|uniref:Uncharacterized protein n=1 Tax=Riccia fluitans TaxID=41844 RepID=A0ABD1XPF3_9MARC
MLEAWGLDGLFAADWSQAHEDLVRELSGHSDQKVTFPKYEYREKPEAWTSEVWREVYNLPKASRGGYVMKGKVQLTELQLLKFVKGDKRARKSGVLLEQVEGNSDFILFCQILNSVLAPGNALEKTITRQVKALGVCNEPTYLGPYLLHLYLHYNEMPNETMEEPKKRKVREQAVFDSETKTEDEKKTKENPQTQRG